MGDRKVWRLLMTGEEDATAAGKVELLVTEFLTGEKPQMVVSPRSVVRETPSPPSPWNAFLSLTVCNAIRFGAFGSAEDDEDADPSLFQEDQDYEDATCDDVVLTTVQDHDWQEGENLFLDFQLFCALTPSTRQLLSESSQGGLGGYRDLVLVD